jgi:glycosyltransferase involved in cell wall biosynthesis
VYLAAERIAAAWTHAYVDVSEAMKRLYVNARIGPETEHHVVRSGMDLGAFRSPTPIGDWRHLLGLREGEPKPPIVLMLAAFEPRKRHAEFIRAFDTVLSVVPTARLVLAGGGDPYHPALEAAIARSARPQNIVRLGYHANPGGLIALADVGVLCSTNEGLPRVVVQYLAGGLPAVVCDMPGIREAIADGRNGVIAKSADLADAATAVAHLLLDRKHLAALQTGARRTDTSAWSIDRMCRDNEAVYARLASVH